MTRFRTLMLHIHSSPTLAGDQQDLTTEDSFFLNVIAGTHFNYAFHTSGRRTLVYGSVKSKLIFTYVNSDLIWPVIVMLSSACAWRIWVTWYLTACASFLLKSTDSLKCRPSVSASLHPFLPTPGMFIRRQIACRLFSFSYAKHNRQNPRSR